MPSNELRHYLKWRKKLKRTYHRFAEHAENALRYEEAEEIHQARVNCRKLLTLLQLLDPADSEGLRARLRKALKALGKVRDGDVQAEAFERMAREEAGTADGETADSPGKEMVDAVKPFVIQLKQDQQAARERLGGRLEKAMNKKFRRKWKKYLDHGLKKQVKEADATRAYEALENRLQEERLKLEQILVEKGVGDPEAAKRLHKARLIVKRLRYLRKEVDFAFNWDAPNDWKELQEQLGHVNDCRVRLDSWLSFSAGETGEGEEARRKVEEQLRGELQQAIGEVRFERGS